jgi:hypothetical protein
VYSISGFKQENGRRDLNSCEVLLVLVLLYVADFSTHFAGTSCVILAFCERMSGKEGKDSARPTARILQDESENSRMVVQGP